MGLYDRLLLAAGRTDLGFQGRRSVVAKEAAGGCNGSIDQRDIWFHEMECLGASQDGNTKRI